MRNTYHLNNVSLTESLITMVRDNRKQMDHN